MATDQERREVAARLRELHPEDRSWWGIHGFDWYMFADSLFDAIGCNRIRNWTDYLADLVEPGDMSQGCRDIVACDRDALLKLADDLDYAGAAVENVAYIDQTFHDAARRIRDALGVES